MARTRKIPGKHFISLLLVLLLGVFAVPEAQGATCEEGIGVPPFLGTETVDPNVLLMIDNSASMLDLAAVGSAGICYDGTYIDETDGSVKETYDGATDYSGYFRPYRPLPFDDLEDAWYQYDLSSGRFVKNAALGEGAVNNCAAVAGTELFNASGAVCVWAVMDNTDPMNPVMTEVKGFAARGNFLNWATASKLDIQKKVLTGGKYDSANGDIILESRGCLNHRYVKQIGVQSSSGSSKVLSLGIAIPAAWRNDTAYPANSVVLYDPDSNPATNNDIGYYSSGGGTSNGTSPADDTGVAWEIRDYADLTQIEIFKVTDGGFNQAACQEALEEMASENPSLGTIKSLIDLCLEQSDVPTTLEADSNAVFNQTTQDCWFMAKHGLEAWEQANLNMINIKNGCEKVYAGLADLGDGPDDILSGDTGYACFGINLDPANEQGYVGRCWNSGQVCTIRTCTGDGSDGYPPAYESDEVCIGGEVYYCSGNYNARKDTCNKDWLPRLDCVGDAVDPGWDEVNPDYADSEECVHDAILDYCGFFNTPEVIDPSDQEGSVSGDYYNAPAILIEAAAEAQLDKPLLTMNGRISSTDPAPIGILKTFAPKFRFGALAFNQEGQLTECDPTGDENLLIDCEDKLDGAQIISYMDISDAHTTQLLAAINDTKANAWTPLAEAMYTAIGYFSQDTTMRLNPSDFLVQAEVDAAATAWATATVYAVGAKVTHVVDGETYTYIANSAGTSCASCSGPVNDILLWTLMPDLMPAVADPVEAYCQSNNVLLISEGASTVDIAPDVVNFVTATSDADTDSGDCGKFKGSSYLDDLAWYSWQGDMWSNHVGKENFSSVRTWIVESAERQISDLAGECQPDQLLTDAAYNGSRTVREDGSESFTPKFTAGGNEVQFRSDLKKAFESILDRVSSGSAASIISASRAGEGALYQAIFWPDKESGRIDAVSGEEILVKWTGEVHAYLVDSRGNLYMDDCKDDTTGCHTGGLDAPVDSDGDGALDTLTDRDTPIVAFFDQSNSADTTGSTANGTKACPASLEGGELVFFDTNGHCRKQSIALESVDYLWSTTNWLNRDDVDSAIEYNRFVVDTSDYKFNFAAASSNPDKRFIFTWNDLNNDGIVDDSEMRDFEPGLPPMGSTSAGSLPSVSTGLGRGPVPVDFGVDPRVADAEDQVNNIIKWVRGEEISGMRERLVPFDKNESGAIEVDEYAVWKLGDVVHSTPISVATPAENYHQLYRDTSYAEFIDRWAHRRHMVYFGANDGMLHAANGGFYDNDLDNDGIPDTSRFCQAPDCGTTTTDTPLLGAEMWAYVPYNLLPHLSCLTEPDYGLDPTGHKYFVDLRPRIFDVQIFDEEAACTTSGFDDPGCIHPNGWGTILVGGMRFGGSEVRPGNFEDDATGDNYADTTNPFHGNGLDYDNRDFTSAYFVLDITDPERVPTLLGEFTRTIDAAGVSSEVELGYTTVISTMVPMKRRDEDVSQLDTDCDGDLSSDPETSMWYLVLGSGPTELDGTSDQNGSVSVVPLHRFIDSYPADVNDPKRNMRIPAAPPAETFDATGHPWNLPPVGSNGGYPVDERGGRGFGTFTLPDADSFVSDTITVDMQIEADYLADVVYFGTVSGTWGDWGGKMYRLVTRKECNGLQGLAQPSEWFLAPLLDADKPIVAAPTVGTDGTDFWVYFGTGRFFDKDDKTDASSNATQTFYGIREPIDIHEDNCNVLSWAEVLNIDPPGLDSILNNPGQITSVDVTTIPKTVTTAPSAGINRGELGLLPVGDIRILATLSQDEPDTLICDGDTGTFVDDNGTPLDPTDDNYAYNVTTCLPSTVLSTATIPYAGSRSFRDLINTISGTSFRCGIGTIGTDGWYRDIPDTRERNLGQATLLGGLVSYTTYTPYDDVCLSEGLGYLYGVYYRTGTAWVEDVFGTVDVADRPRQENPDRMYLGKGLSTTPNIHIGKGEGGKAFVQTSVGQIVEIPQPNLPSKHVKSGRIKWRDIEQ